MSSDTPPEIRRVVMATDFSENADSAFRAALALARDHGARLVVAHAIDASPVRITSLGLQAIVRQSLEVLEARAADAGVEVESRSATGRPWEVVAEIAVAVGADLLVVGTRGHTGYANVHLGSTADRIIRTARAPVLVVPPGSEGAVASVGTILVPTDFSEGAARATAAALCVLAVRPAPHRLVLLHAWQPLVEYEFDATGGVVTSPLEQTEEQAQEALEGLAARLQQPGLEVRTVIRQGYPARVIRKEAEALGADLIALGTHGRSGLERFFLGSVTERVLHHAPCPVLTVHRPGASPAGADASAAAATGST